LRVPAGRTRMTADTPVAAPWPSVGLASSRLFDLTFRCDRPRPGQKWPTSRLVADHLSPRNAELEPIRAPACRARVDLLGGGLDVVLK
jgi:hypothetical protein